MSSNEMLEDVHLSRRRTGSSDTDYIKRLQTSIREHTDRVNSAVPDGFHLRALPREAPSSLS